MELILILFCTFFKIGLLSIGGGYAIIPLIQEEVVETSGWITQKVFTDIITISQMTPGPLAVNTSTFVGLQTAGLLGAIAATIGCVIGGVFISLYLYRFFSRHHESIIVFEILNGLKSASLGLIVSASATILLLCLFNGETINSNTIDLWACLIFTSMFILLRKYHLDPMIIMLISGICGLIFYL